MRSRLGSTLDWLACHARELLVGLLVISAAVPFPPPLQLPAALLIYALAARTELRWAVGGSIAVVCVSALHRLAWDGRVASGETISTAVFCLAAVAFGQLRALRRAAAQRERELTSARAVAEERLRIARELHDAVGHDVTLMVVQAQALGATHPDVTEHTDAIADLGRHTMRELHRTLKVLREEPGTAPAPGLGGLGKVLDDARAAGVAVTYSVEGDPRALGSSLDLSAYRIVQEALTNVVRHAGPAAATVTVTYGADALELHVSDDGAGKDPAAADGHGLAGMRERAAMLGGSVRTGAGADGGFEVHSVLPYA